MGQNRLDLPNGAESTCLGRREDTAYRGFHPPEAVRFQTIKQEIRRIPILKLRLAVELLNKQTRNVFFVSEILGDLPYETADNVAKALVNGLWKCFGISTTAHILDERNTHLAISE